MTVTKIRMGGKMFILDPEQDTDALKRAITEAALSGAGFVRFETAGHVSVSALVTPYLPVRISEIEQPADQQSESAETFLPAADHHFDG